MTRTEYDYKVEFGLTEPPLGPRQPPIREPSPVELAANFAEATLRWANAGFGVVSKEEYGERKSACLSCSDWDAAGYFGLGKCRLCGCGKGKLFLASESCPRKRWASDNPSPAQGKPSPEEHKNH